MRGLEFFLLEKASHIYDVAHLRDMCLCHFVSYAFSSCEKNDCGSLYFMCFPLELFIFILSLAEIHEGGGGKERGRQTGINGINVLRTDYACEVW